MTYMNLPAPLGASYSNNMASPLLATASPQMMSAGLNTPPSGGGAGAQQLKTGGRVRSRHHKMIAAHFSPAELHVLDQLQGSIERSKKDGRRSYPKLDAVLANPHISGHVHRHASDHLAHGGQPHDHMTTARPQFGMHGDTELAYIGPHLRHLLDSYAGHKTHNPMDGHPQYFSLGGLFGGIGNALSGGLRTLGSGISSVASKALPVLGGIARTALPGLANMAGNAIGGAVGAPEAGNVIGGVLGNLGNSALDSLGASQQGQGSQAGEAIGQGINTAANMYNQGGYTPQQMAGMGIQSAGTAYGGTPGAALQGFGNAYGGGQNLQTSALHGALGGLGSWLQSRQQQPQPSYLPPQQDEEEYGPQPYGAQ